MASSCSSTALWTLFQPTAPLAQEGLPDPTSKRSRIAWVALFRRCSNCSCRRRARSAGRSTCTRSGNRRSLPPYIAATASSESLANLIQVRKGWVPSNQLLRMKYDGPSQALCFSPKIIHPITKIGLLLATEIDVAPPPPGVADARVGHIVPVCLSPQLGVPRKRTRQTCVRAFPSEAVSPSKPYSPVRLITEPERRGR